jgi:hypothetical protein
MRQESKQLAQRRFPAGVAALGLNVMRFPPGFFNEIAKDTSAKK